MTHPAARERPGVDLYALPPWDNDHDFPHRRIVRKVAKATAAYPCDMQGAGPAGHTPTIPAGAAYLRVTIRPERDSSGGWRLRRLCPACALFLRLAARAPYHHEPQRARV